MDNDWNAPGFAPQARGAAVTASPQDLLAEYGARLDLVVARATEDALPEALAALERLTPPAFQGGDGAYLRDRKRRELLARFGMLSHVLCRLPALPTPLWVRFFLASAEMAGSDALTMRWDPPPPGLAEWERLPLHRVEALQGPMLMDARLTDISHSEARGRALASVSLETGWLTLSGTPFFVEQSLRELDRLSRQSPLGFSLEYDRGREMQEGSLLNVQIRLRNQSQDVLVLETLHTPDGPHEPESFFRPSYGHLHHDAASGTYAYQALSQGEGSARFHTAVLAPGDERLVGLQRPVLEGGDRFCLFQLRYRRLSLEEARQCVYVPYQPPWEAFPSDLTYVPWGRAAAAGEADLSSVVVHGAAKPLGEMVWAYPLTIQRRAFSLAEARQLVPDALEPVHFSRWQQAWVFRTGDGSALVSRARISRYARMAPESFALIDDASQRVPVRFEDGLLATFKALPLGLTDWEGHDLGLSATLPKYKLNAFLQEVERLGLALDVRRNVVGRMTLWVGG